MSTDASNYAEAKTAQTWFREAIDVCMKGQVDALQSHVEKYLHSNPKISAQDLLTDFKSEGKTLIHVAASSGHHSVLDYLVSKSSKPAELVNIADERGFTPIINATVSESDAAMLLLLQLGANVNARNNDGAAAIHFAAGDGSVSRLKLLCDAGADISVMSQAGNALHWAAGKGRGEAIRFLVNQVNQTTTTLVTIHSYRLSLPSSQHSRKSSIYPRIPAHTILTNLSSYHPYKSRL